MMAMMALAMASAASAGHGFLTHAVIDSAGKVTACSVAQGPARMKADGCGVFGSDRFLRYALGRDFSRVRSADVRLSISMRGAVEPAADVDAYHLLAEAAVTFAPSGRMSECRTIKSFVAPGRTIDLCELMRADPPVRPASARPASALYLLEVSGHG